MTALLRYDAACMAIAEAKTVDEVSDWIDKAAAVREYTRRIKNRQLEIDAIEIRVRAKRRRGELLLQLKDQGKLREGRKKLSPADDSFSLDDLGISRNESSEEQKIAQVDGNSFERLLARCRAYAEAHPEKHTFNVLNPPPSGPSATMHSRAEPADSLDYFPTPPWATRALMEHVWPVAVPSGCKGSVWEPACGEGHMAEVLKEYFGKVVATDIHDYGYGDRLLDFTSEKTQCFEDWIITNPPFGEKAERFVLRALEQAHVGVAMFFRTQWLETPGRYNRIFKPHPPSLIAQFAERVPVHKGRWEPDGDTLTAYCWIVWFPARQAARGLTEFFWIPPGCRDTLTKPDDAERFTAHPVIKKAHLVCDEPFDKNTGEILSPAAGDVEPAGNPEPVPEETAPAGAGSPSNDDGLDIPPFLRRTA